MFGLDIPEILRFGAIGLGLLLALMAYRLLSQAMQQPKVLPRRYIAIGSFMVFSVLLVAIGVFEQLSTGRKLTDDFEHALHSYLVRESVHVLDLRTRVAGASADEPSRVMRRQLEVVKKTRSDAGPYVTQHGTSSDLGMEFENISHRHAAKFIPREGGGVFDAKLKHNYENRVPLPKIKAGQETAIITQRTYKNGFQDESSEWMAAEIVYPTERLVIVILFPADKPAKNVRAQWKIGDTPIERDITTKPLYPEEESGPHAWVYWSFSDLRQGEKLQIDFDW